MKTIELFCGTKSFSKVAKERGHSILTLDIDAGCDPGICCDISSYDFFDIITMPVRYDVLWSSPPCTAFSVASISRHWTGGKGAYVPRSESASSGIALVEKTIRVIKGLKPRYWYIENPRGVMRKIIDDIFKDVGFIEGKDYRRNTVTYCQYGDKRMKPTDIWTNDLGWNPRKMCRNGDACHESAPRGAKTGTQGLKGAKERGVIPRELFIEIFERIEQG